MKSLIFGAFVVALTQPLLVDEPDPVPPPSDRMVVDVVTVNGSGCPAGTAAVAVTPDGSDFSVTFSAYTAWVGVGAKPLETRRNCQLSLVVHVPWDHTYTVSAAPFRGFASLAAGASALYRANYYFQGQASSQWRSQVVTGPFDDDVDVSGEGVGIWSPCGVKRNLNINTEIRVYAGTSDTRRTTSFATLNEVQGFTFQVKPCTS
jgi:hypothetical protein